VSLDRKVAWLLRLEQQRQLRDAAVASAPLRTDSAGRLIRKPATTADLAALAADTDPVVRRRAALAIGRVGLAEGEPVLAAALKDDDEFVRETAAFAMGLLGQEAAAPALEAALKDPSAAVRGRAAEGLGLIGKPASAPAIADVSSGCRAQLAGIAPDDEALLKTPEIEACRLALLALVRLKSYDALARVALDENGQPVSTWWPIAFALQRIHDSKAAPALLALARVEGAIYTPAFAIRGLAALGDQRVVPIAQAIAANTNADVRLRIAAVSAMGRLAGPAGTNALLDLLRAAATPRNLAVEVVTAIGATKDPRAFDALLAQARDPWPTMRAAALGAAASVDAEDFLLVVPSLGADRDWSVRAALAGIFAKLAPDRVRGALEDLMADTDTRVRGPALEALAAIHAPDLPARLSAALEAPDFVLRTTAARLMGEARPEGGAEKLVAAYARASSDATYSARVAALESLTKYGGDAAKMTLRRALADPEWPVRTRAAALLASLGETDVMSITPAPIRQAAEFFESDRLLHPKYSPLAIIETARGTIEIELDVVSAPLSTASFVELARAGFFTGLKIHRLVPNFVAQAGDPRGDGEGGPGYTIRDELSPTPYVRGTVGMALDFKDTGGSQFFITLSPQPHLDGKYTVFGKVVKGLDVLDQLSQWDVIERVRIWDGESTGSGLR
jgi:cyclophilin family peptidyl-prolyl cis-trans isomerase/HEAT repeat protein